MVIRKVIFFILIRLTISSFPNNYWNKTGLLFDEDLMLYTRENMTEQIFEYDSEHICVLSKYNGTMYIGIRSIYEFAESISQRSISSHMKVYACFFHKGKSYIFTKDPNSISNSQLISLPNNVQYINIIFDLLRYDIVTERIITYQSGSIKIYNLSDLLKMSTTDPIISIESDNSCTDIKFIKGKIYCLFNYTIFKLDSNHFKFYSTYFTNYFQFLLLPKIDKNEPQTILCNLNSHLFLYLIDLIVIFLLVCIFRNRIALEGRFGNIRYSPPPIIRNISEKEMEKINLTVNI